MTQVDTSLRPFVPGTTGWSAADLDDPEIERLWSEGRYEIIDGVLATMAPARYAGGRGLSNLLFACKLFVRDKGLGGWFSVEADIILEESRVVVADLLYMSDEAAKKQERVARQAGKNDSKRTRILVPPTLVVESVSLGHEQHDRLTKLRWYAEFGVPNYWILDAFNRTLECRVLEGDSYRLEASGNKSGSVSPSLFPGLAISLPEIWQD
jgi:Uma2 family endonuclease